MTTLHLGLALGMAVVCSAAQWPQFRGPDGLGVADGAAPPAHFGPGSNVLWKVPVPNGHSSPCIWNERIFLTGFDGKKLETICLDRATGASLWRQPAPA